MTLYNNVVEKMYISENNYFLYYKIKDEYDPDKSISFEWEDLEYIKEYAQHLLDSYGGNKIRIMHNDDGIIKIATTVYTRNKSSI